MSVDLLRESLQRQGKEEDLEMALLACEELGRLRQLLSDLLDLSRIEAGKIELDILPVTVQALIDGVCTHLGVSDGETLENGARLNLPRNEKTTLVLADLSKTVWILSNLMTNSMKYATGATFLDIEIRKGREFLFVTVSDDGPGIPQEYRSRIFDKFIRVETKSDPGGTGLGLSICREMVRAQHGTIWYEENTGGGARFSFTLPLSFPESTEENIDEKEDTDS
jgi:NtrC-family two-component system sensor histidine kinase KinB